MLIYTYKLEKFVKSNFFPKILMVPNKYMIKGSFRRKVPYVTDIDIVNTVYPQINKTNIYDNLVTLIKRVQKENDKIILAFIRCGYDNRFKIVTAGNDEIEPIKKLLTTNEAKEVDLIMEKYHNNQIRKIFYLNEIIWPFYKIMWSPQEVLDNKKILRAGIPLKITDVLQENSSLLLSYFLRIGSYPVGADVVVVYDKVDLKNTYEAAGNYQIRYANYAKEYYYMLFPFRYYFRDDKEKLNELNEVIEQKFGLYKQLMVRIDTYLTLYQNNLLDITTATGIVNSIVKDVAKLSDFKSNILSKISEASLNNPPDVKMAEWNILLDTLYDEINFAANSAAREYFYKFLNMLPENKRDQFYLKNLRNLRKFVQI